MNIPFTNAYNFCLTVISANGCSSTYCDSVSFDSLGVINRAANNMLAINILSPQTITGYTATGVKQSAQNDVQVLPNPFDNIFSILNTQSTYQRVEVLSIDGKLMHNRMLNENVNPIETSEWPAGMYFVKLTAENGHQQMIKMLKK
jgi:hypothetical protein